MGEIKGYISQVIGPVVDIHFDYGTEETVTLPRIHDAMEISRPNGKILIVEVQQHIGENTVRTVAMDTTDGLRRGMEAVSYGMPITMPTGDQVKGRLMNVTGDPIDGMAQLTKDGALPIHREPPKFEDLTTTQEVLYTGIKVIGTLRQRRQDRTFRRSRSRQNGIDHGIDQQHRKEKQRILRLRRCG